MGLNDGYIGTKGQKVKRIAALNDYVVKTIDADQEIRRLLRYNTDKPLSSKGEDLSGNIISQPDLLLSLTKEGVEGVKCLYKGGFAPEMVSTEQNYIFAHVFRGDYSKDNIGKLVLVVSILIDDAREDLKYSYESRSVEIASRIEDMFDKMFIEDEMYVDILGNLKFDLVKYDYTRLSKTNSITWTSLIFDTSITTMRV